MVSLLLLLMMLFLSLLLLLLSVLFELFGTVIVKGAKVKSKLRERSILKDRQAPASPNVSMHILCIPS